MYIRNTLPKRLFATGQGIFGATIALGNVLGNIFGGMLYEAGSPREFYLTAAMICLIAAVFAWRRRKLQTISSAV